MSGVLKLGGVTVATEADGAVSLDSTLISNISMSANHAGVKTALNASGDAPIYACRAWVNFQGSSGTTADYKTIRNSGNVSSVYENSLGDYTINFAIAMPDANYAVTWEGDQVMLYVPNLQSTSSCRVVSRNGSNANADCSIGVVTVIC